MKNLIFHENKFLIIKTYSVLFDKRSAQLNNYGDIKKYMFDKRFKIVLNFCQ